MRHRINWQSHPSKDECKKKERRDALLKKDGVAERLKEYSAHLHKEENRQFQRAQLLIRNEEFQRDSHSGPMDGGWMRDSRGAADMARRWNINLLWDGRDETIQDYIGSSSILIYQARKGFAKYKFLDAPSGMAADDPYGEFWADEGQVKNEDAFIYIKIDEWTRKEDVASPEAWDKIKELQKAIYSVRARKKEMFARDLTWYDLNKKFGINYNQIASLWEMKFRIRPAWKSVREAVQEIERKINAISHLRT